MTIMLQRDNQHYGTLVKCIACTAEYKLEMSYGIEPQFCTMCGNKITKLIWCSPQYPRWIRDITKDERQKDILLTAFNNKMRKNAEKAQKISIVKYQWTLGEWVKDLKHMPDNVGSMQKAMAIIDGDIEYEHRNFCASHDNFSNSPQCEDDYVDNCQWEVNKFEYKVKIGDRSVFVKFYNEWDWVPETHKEET